MKIATAPLFIDGMAHYPYDAGLEGSLRFFNKFGDAVNPTVAYGSNLAVPRQLAPVNADTIDRRISRPLQPIAPKLPARSEDQAQAIERSLYLLKQGTDHVIEAPTGWGKTYVGSTIAARLGETTLIVVTKQDLMDSWRSTLVNLIGIPENQIGIAQGDKLAYKGKRFVLGMVHSLSMEDKYDDDFWQSFGLVLFDETHRMAADSFVRVCQRAPARHRLGLSATPKRNDGKTNLIRWHIGEIMVNGVTVPMVPKVLVKNTGWSIPSWIKDFAPGRMAHVTGAMNTKDRNQLVTEFVEAAFAAGRTVVVMADTLNHLRAMALSIGEAIGGEHVDFYVGSRSKTELVQAARKRVVMATYGMCAEGTDYPHWDTLVLASPRANVKQPVGRVLRSMEGKREPVVLDLVDNHSVFKAFYRKREKTYFDLKAKIVRVSS